MTCWNAKKHPEDSKTQADCQTSKKRNMPTTADCQSIFKGNFL